MEQLPPLDFEKAVAAVLSAKNAWVAGDARKPEWIELNEPWFIAFVYDGQGMSMCLYAPRTDDPKMNVSSAINVTPDDLEGEQFGFECVSMMEQGVRGVVEQPRPKMKYQEYKELKRGRPTGNERQSPA